MLLLFLGSWPGHGDHGGPLRPITPSWYGTSTLGWMPAVGGAEQSDFQDEGDESPYQYLYKRKITPRRMWGRKRGKKSPPRARYGHLEGDVGRLRNSCRAASGGKLVYGLKGQ